VNNNNNNNNNDDDDDDPSRSKTLTYNNVKIYTCLHSETSVQFVGNHHHKHTDMYPSYFHKHHWNKYHLYGNIHQYLEKRKTNMIHNLKKFGIWMVIWLFYGTETW